MELDTSSSTSASLLERIRLNDEEAWHRLVVLYAPLVDAWCGRWQLAHEVREDIVQEVFRAVALSIHKFRRERDSDTFRGWLWTITLNKMRDWMRREVLQATGKGGTDYQGMLEQIPETLSEPTDESLGVDTEKTLLQRALALLEDKFEPRTWQAFWRTTVSEERAADVAADLGMSVGAVHQSKHRVLRRLRQELSGLVD